MQVHIEDISPVEKKVAIEVDWPQVARKLDDAYRELGRDVNLRGFRKGKVPRSVLERMFGRQVEQQVKQQLVQESFLRARQQHAIDMVADPIVDDMAIEQNKGFRFSARVEVAAQFEPRDYLEVALEHAAPTVDDEEVDAALRAKQKEFTEYRRIEDRTELASGDTVIADIEGQAGGHPVKRDACSIDVGAADGEPGVIPGLGLALVGVPREAKAHEVAFTAPTEPPEGGAHAEQRDAAGQQVRLKVTIREAREKLVPALDDDLAKDTGEAETLDELRAKLRTAVAARKDQEQQRVLRTELVKKVLESNPFQVAPALVERQAEQMVRRARIQLAMQGIDPRTVPLDEQRLKDDLRPQAIEEVRAGFLLDAIATREKVDVTDADLEKRLAELAKERGKHAARLKAELQKENRLDAIRHQIREEKTLDLLMSRAIITVKR